MNIVAPPAETVVRRTFTVADYGRMIDAGVLGHDERVELIEGDLVVMASQHIGHERIKHVLTTAFAKAAGEDVFVAIESAMQLTETTLVLPDLAVVSRKVYDADPKTFAKPRGSDILLLVEVAVTSLAFDRRTKARLYARHGVGEYWVIDASERVTYVHTSPQGDGWQSVIARAADEILTSAALPGFAITLAQIG